MSAEPLWTPSDEWIASTRLDRFRREVRPGAADSDALWQWSVDEPGAFWRSVWDWCGVVGTPGDRDLETGAEFRSWRFLPDAELNIVDTLLAPRDGVAGSDDAIVAVVESEDGDVETRVSWDDLRTSTAAMAAALQAAGVGPGDRVAAWMPHVPETVIAFLAAASIGAVFTSTSSDFGTSGVVDRFGQTEPTVLVAADGYRYGGKAFDCLDRLAEIRSQLPSVREVWVVDQLGSTDGVGERIPGARAWTEVEAAHTGAVLAPTPLPSDHPLYILYSSGTTGKPKCIVHRSGGVLLKHLTEQQLHSDIGPGDRILYFTTAGWMMWNWLASCLGSGAAIVLVDGNPGHPSPWRLFELAERHEVTLLGLSAKFIDVCLKAGMRPMDRVDLTPLRTICSTGSPLSDEGFRWIHDAVKADVHLASISGGTDLCGCLVAGDPTKPTFVGQIQRKAFGLGIEVYDDDAVALGTGVKGELVCTTPFPSMPLGFWGDDGDERYHGAYFARFPAVDGGVWAHGDFASWTEEGGMVIHGRSDATLNASGVRIGTAEIYGAVEARDDITEAIAIGQQWDDDTRIVLFVRMAEGIELDADRVGSIKRDVRTMCSPRHVPAVVVAVDDIPRTRSGKITELAVTDVVHGREVKNVEALANPESLDLFRNLPELS